MNQHKGIRLASYIRLLAFTLLLGLALIAGNLLSMGTAHAQSLGSVSITDCTDDSQLQSAVANASSGDTITFACSGDIKLSKTLTIATNLTLDGSGQNVTLDGNNSVQVLFVDSGVSFTLNALTIAHGAASFGGGLYNNGTVSISNSAFTSNSASIFGGGLYNNGTVTISNSTFANNSVPGFMGLGGGLYNDGTVTISNSTFANNSATGFIGIGGGGLYNGGTVSISASIFADNPGSNCFEQTGTIYSQGYNLSDDGSCGFTASTDQQNADPKLDPNGLQNNGGPTQTIALHQDSPAINKIPASSCPATDQRGISRPQGPACDIGAFEFRAPTLNLPTSPVTANATSPNGATVTYTATGTEPDDASATPTMNCTPASGSVFPIGNTTVNCTASDAATPPDTTTGSFQVVVNGAAVQVSNLITTVNSFNLSPQGIQTSFDSQLQAVQTDLTNNNTTQACSDLTSFINHAQAQSGKHLTVSQANQMMAAAKQIQAVLGC